MNGLSHEDLYLQARLLFEEKSYSKAIFILKKLLHVQGYEAKAMASIGACLYHLASYRAARRYLSRALAIQPSFTSANFSLAHTLVTLGDHQEAAKQYALVSSRDPENDEAWQGAFDSLLILGDIEACEALIKSWKVNIAKSKMRDVAVAFLFRAQGKNSEAIREAHRSLSEYPDNSRLYALISEVLLERKQLEDALIFIKQALLLAPFSIDFHCIKANIHFFMSQVSECAAAYAQAYALSPSSATLFLNQHCLFPIIADSSEEIHRCRNDFLDSLTLAEESSQLELILKHPISLHTFHLAYHNRNDRDLLERYLKLMKRLAEPLLNKLANSKKPSSLDEKQTLDKKIRIGFLSRYFYSHSNTFAFEGLIRYLRRDKFIVILIHSAGSQEDEVQASLNSCCDEVITLSSKFEEVYHTLHHLSLDILYFTDLGMTPYDFLLPFMRSCRIQLTGWGIPHTSGNSEIDFYISAQGLEPEHAKAHYTENLILLPGNLPCCFLLNEQEVPHFPREYFFLPSHCQLIGCLQLLHKIHPDFDYVMEEIAKQNPSAIFVFVEDSVSQSTQRFIHRLAEYAPSVREQSLFLRIMGRGEYQALCKCMDILLDPIYYGSGITFFEAARVGTPIITLEGDYLRSRTVSAGYREMNLEGAPIASTEAEYVELATGLLQENDRREDLRDSILNHNHRLYNRYDLVRNFEEFCINVISSKDDSCINLQKDLEHTSKIA